MAIPSELNRILPRFDETPTDAHARNYARFLSGLDRKTYEEVLHHLPDRLARQGVVVKDEAAWIKFTDFVCHQSILNYTRFVMGGEIVDLLSRKKGLGSDLYRLVLMMSEAPRKRIVSELLAAEVKEYLAFLEDYFKGDRIGMVDFAVEEILRGFKEEKERKQAEIRIGYRNPNDTGLSRKKVHDERVLSAIQDQRRKDPNRLPASLATSYRVRFLAEEVSRELFSYPQPSEAKASQLIGTILNWFEDSPMRRSTRHNVPIYLVETGFFADLLDVRRKIAGGGSYRGHWDMRIQPSLRSETFWHNIAGLNHDIRIETTEAGRRQEVYQRAAMMGGLIFAGLLLLPLGIKLAFAVPGAVIRLVQWTGSQLLLATQYAYSTFKVYGLIGGAANMVRDGYRYYMQNPAIVNHRIVDVVEFFVEIFTPGSGLAPGSSPADITRHVTAKMAVLTGRKELSKLVNEAKAVTGRADTKVDLVQIIVEDKDHKLYEVTAKIAGYQDGKVKLTRLSQTDVTGKVDEEARKTITFFGQPHKDVDRIADPRATRNNGVTGTGSDPKVLDQTAQAAPVDELALRRQKMVEQQRLEAQKAAENLAQKAELKKVGTQKVANAPDTVVIDMARKRGVQGGGDPAVVGHTTTVRGGPDAKARSTGSANVTQDSRAVKDRANGSHLRSVPADPPPGTRLGADGGYWIIKDEALLKPLKRAGFQVEATGLKSPKSGGGRYQKYVSDSDAEWRVSLGDVSADIDALAVDNLKAGRLVAVEAKATFVEDAGKSAHLVFYPKKTEQLARQLVLCLESRGLMRMEIVANATSGAETYMNITVQQLARELRKRFGQQVKDFIKHSSDKTVKRLSLDAVEQIVEDNVTVVVAEWPPRKRRR